MSEFDKLFRVSRRWVWVVIALTAAGCVTTRSGRSVAADPEQAYSQAVATAQENKNDVNKAAAAYDMFLARYPRHSLAANALLNQGVLYHNEADALFSRGTLHPDSYCVHKAVNAYDAFLRRFPGHGETSNVLMKKGLIYTNSGDTRKAIRAYDLFLKRFPDDSQAGNVRSKRDALRHLGGR